jgi:hypothetical protein
MWMAMAPAASRLKRFDALRLRKAAAASASEQRTGKGVGRVSMGPADVP